MMTSVVLALAAILGLAGCGGGMPSEQPAATDLVVATSDPQAPDPTPVPDPKHEVVGFVPYWEMDDGIAAHLAATDLTTLALFSVTHRRSGELATTQTGYRRIAGDLGDRLVREAHDRGTRVEVVYTSFGARKNERFYTEPAARERWIEELVELVDDLGLDGVNVDVEGLPAEHIPAYGAFVGDLRRALREADAESSVSVSTQANARGAAMAAAAAEAGADRVVLMGYDYHWEGSEPGASAPLERLDGRAEDLPWSLDLYADLGVPVERTVLALPLYGVTWPVVGPELGAPSTGRGDSWVPRRNLRVFEDPDFAPTYDPQQSVEFYAVERPVGVTGEGEAATPDPAEGGQWHAVYYDSPRSLTPKLALADARGLAGAGFWAVGYERGLPGYGELIETFRAGELGSP